MSPKAFVGATLFALVFWTCLPVPARAQGVGAIGGTITDGSGAVLPGVTVTLSNPGIIGGNQEAVTTERGTFLFSRLVPGRYAVQANLVGSRSITAQARQAIPGHPGQVRPLGCAAVQDVGDRGRKPGFAPS